MKLERLKASFNDRNGKVSSKRVWAAIVISDGLLIANVNIAMKVLIAFSVILPENSYEVETSLILGILGVGAGLFASTVVEKQNTVLENHKEEEPYQEEAR